MILDDIGMEESKEGDRGWRGKGGIAGLPLHPTIQKTQTELKVEVKRKRLTGTGAGRGVLDIEESLGVRHDCG